MKIKKLVNFKIIIVKTVIQRGIKSKNRVRTLQTMIKNVFTVFLTRSWIKEIIILEIYL